MANILTVARDEAFAIILKEGLEGMGVHQVQVAYSEEEVQQIISNQDIALAIVDVDLKDVEPVELVQALRQRKPELRVMWMPFLGHELSEEMQAVNTQGILTKPFFMEDLPNHIEQALSQPEPTAVSATSSPPGLAPRTAEITSPGGFPVSEEGSIAAEPVAATGMSPETVKDSFPGNTAIQNILNRLALELDAEAVIIANRMGDLLARAGHMNERRAVELASSLMDEIAAADIAAVLLREKGGHFVNHVHEGREFRLFSVILSNHGLALSVITVIDAPLGTVRYHVRQAATEMTGLIQGVE